MNRPRLVTFRGETLALSAMAKRYGVTEANVHRRLGLGWSMEEALLVPLRPRRWRSHRLRPRATFRARCLSGEVA